MAALCGAVALTMAACSGDDGDDVAGDGSGGSITTVPAATTAVPVDTTGAADYSDPVMPDWIQRVRPSPDADTSAERAVSVDAVTLDESQELRLIIDGVDVTAQALVSEPSGSAGVDGQPATNDQLRYDPRDTSTPLVELAPGDHSATAELRERSEFGAQSVLLDSYTWQFNLQ
ncbi:MAG: hypothetical protein AB7O92_29085 [Acidimicrobiia bacterium]